MKHMAFAVALIGLMTLTSLAFASNAANQTVNVSVAAINEVTLGSGTVTLQVHAATAGQDPDEVSDSSKTYAITTNGASKKITGALDSAMPTDTTLKINVAAPSVGMSLGDVALTASAQNLVTGLSKVKGSSLGITFKLSALVTAGVVSAVDKTVTLTVADQ